jgi:putative intracellular protease/amidase
MLVSADVLKGKKVTSYVAIKDDMVNAGAAWEDSELVRDGNLITSRKPEDLPAFCRTIVSAMGRAVGPCGYGSYGTLFREPARSSYGDFPHQR